MYVHHTMTGHGIYLNNARDVLFEKCRARFIGYGAFNYMSYVPGSSYEWDALGATSVVYVNGVYSYAMLNNVIFKNCSTERVAGCSFYGLNSFNLEIGGCRVYDNVGYTTEDAIMGTQASRGRGVYRRSIHDNVYDYTGTIYSWTTDMRSDESLCLDIHDNTFTHHFGNQSHSKVTSRGFVTINDTAKSGKVYFNFINNDLSTNDTYTADAPSTYGGLNGLFTNGIVNIKNNSFSFNNSSNPSTNCIGSIAGVNIIDFSYNKCYGYFNYTGFEFTNSGSASIYTPIYTAVGNSFYNRNANYNSSNGYNSALGFSMTANMPVTRMEDNYTNVGHVGTFQTSPSFLRASRNHTAGGAIIQHRTGSSTLLAILTENVHSSVNPYSGNFTMHTKTIIDNNISTT